MSEVVELDIEVGEDQPLADPLPDDPRHLVAVDLDDGVFYLDLGHVALPPGRWNPGLLARVDPGARRAAGEPWIDSDWTARKLRGKPFNRTIKRDGGLP